MGINIAKYVKAWGLREHKIRNLKPQEVSDLSVLEQRKCKAYIMEQLTYA
jgi:hypothetical protein